MSFAASVISLVLKYFVNNKLEDDFIKELAGLQINEISEQGINKINDFINTQRSKIETILSKENLKLMDISEEHVDFVAAEIKDFLLEIELTDEVLKYCRYDEKRLTEFLWNQYCGITKNIEYEDDMKKAFHILGTTIDKLKSKSEGFQIELSKQINSSVEDIKEELYKLSDYIKNSSSQLDENVKKILEILYLILNKVKSSNLSDTVTCKKSKTIKYADKWNANMFLNNFDKRDENAGVNVKLSEVYLEFHLPHYIWKANHKTRDDLKELLYNYTSKNTDDKMLLILGQPGIGKSTLITWIMAKFAENIDNILVFQFASDLQSIDWNHADKNFNILNDIIATLNLSYNDIYGKILILDGFDEIYIGSGREKILNKIFQMQGVSGGFSLIITCRENYILDLSQVQCNYITLQVWDSEQIQSFCEIYQKKTNSSISQNTLENILKNRQILGIPLILYMVLALNIEIKKDSSIVDVYDQIFSLRGGIYDRCIKNIEYGNFHRISEMKEAIHEISRRIAMWMFENNAEKASIHKEKYEKICNIVIKEQKQQNEQIKQDALIGNYFKLVKYCEGIETEELYFVHRSIYEYFVAEKICDEIKDIMIDLSDKNQEKLAKVIAINLATGKLTPTIGKYLAYKIMKVYHKLGTETQIEFYPWWELMVSKMLQNGMLYYTQQNIRNYKEVVNKECNCFLNILKLTRLLFQSTENRNLYIMQNISIEHLEKYIKYCCVNNKGQHKEVFDLSNMYLVNIELANMMLKYTNLNNTILRGANFNESNLENAKLQNADLTKAKLIKTNLIGADLTNADLTKAKLIKADLTGANLKEAKLVETSLEGADLTEVDLRNVELTTSDLTKANLQATIWYEDNIIKILPKLKNTNFTYLKIQKGDKIEEKNRDEVFQMILK